MGAAVGAPVHAAAVGRNSALGNSALWAAVLILTMTLVVAVHERGYRTLARHLGPSM
ncbi:MULTISPECIES: hypothetical protein [Rhodococcus]|uniref:hypothetical protein n=1 Tax=Rhodococcus TaxID=1827 RepID=UPI001E2F1279|nr:MULTISPECIES: hypothetical protein [Rhodococcus]